MGYLSLSLAVRAAAGGWTWRTPIDWFNHVVCLILETCWYLMFLARKSHAGAMGKTTKLPVRGGHYFHHTSIEKIQHLQVCCSRNMWAVGHSRLEQNMIHGLIFVSVIHVCFSPWCPRPTGLLLELQRGNTKGVTSGSGSLRVPSTNFQPFLRYCNNPSPSILFHHDLQHQQAYL